MDSDDSDIELLPTPNPTPSKPPPKSRSRNGKSSRPKDEPDFVMIDQDFSLGGVGHGNAVAGPSRLGGRAKMKEDVQGVEVLEQSGGSRSKNGQGIMDGLDKGCLQARLTKLEAEITSVEDQLHPLQLLHQTLSSERQALLLQISSLPTASAPLNTAKQSRANANGKASLIDYMDGQGKEGFEWRGMLKRKMKEVWGIEGFRLCQEGVCNANMDGRDILCVMPTGGGKSLTYQLPALLSPGTTIVISPLLSLISDQIMHLRDFGVDCVALTGSMSQGEQGEVLRRMTDRGGGGGREIKLCYVTPEKVAKSKRFVAALEQLASANRLARIVIDEAHCCSALGHDFRPDYKKLSVLKTVFPRVPILAVTATLSSKVLPDLLKILRLPAITDGRAAAGKGTVFFSAPLYRRNLHYSVAAKPANAKAATEQMANYITEKHLNESGIVYVLSKKDAETVAEGLMTASGGRIKTATYHADVDPRAKERIHRDWKAGKIHCVCATIAFGLGIDKAETRYVLHASLSKSLDNFYQETGRAGRDGKDADCVLFFRGQDASRLASLTLGETEGQDKLHDMLKFAQDVTTCRKIAFANYFSTSASISTNAWDDNDSGEVDRCGHCDNCTRAEGETETMDVTLEVWKVLQVMSEVERNSGRVTLSGLADLARGLGGGQYSVVSTGRKGQARVSDEKAVVNMGELCGSKVSLSKERTETLVLDMVLEGFLKEDFHPTAYSVNVYMLSGNRAIRLSRISKDKAEANDFPLDYTYTFLSSGKSSGGASKKRKRSEKSVPGSDDFVADSDDDVPLTKKPAKTAPSKAKKPKATQKKGTSSRKGGYDDFDSDIERMAMQEAEEDDDFMVDEDDMPDSDDDVWR